MLLRVPLYPYITEVGRKKVLDAKTFASKSRIVPPKSCQMRGSSSELRARVIVTMSRTFCVCRKMKRKNQAQSKSLIL